MEQIERELELDLENVHLEDNDEDAPVSSCLT